MGITGWPPKFTVDARDLNSVADICLASTYPLSSLPSKGSFRKALHPYCPGERSLLKPPQCVLTQWCWRWRWRFWCGWYGKEWWLNFHVSNTLWKLVIMKKLRFQGILSPSHPDELLEPIIDNISNLSIEKPCQPLRGGAFQMKFVTSLLRHPSLSLWKGPSPQTKQSHKNFIPTLMLAPAPAPCAYDMCPLFCTSPCSLSSSWPEPLLAFLQILCASGPSCSSFLLPPACLIYCYKINLANAGPWRWIRTLLRYF